MGGNVAQAQHDGSTLLRRLAGVHHADRALHHAQRYPSADFKTADNTTSTLGEQAQINTASGIAVRTDELSTSRQALRLSLEPHHAVLLIIILLCALSLSVSISVRQGIVLVRQAQQYEQVVDTSSSSKQQAQQLPKGETQSNTAQEALPPSGDSSAANTPSDVGKQSTQSTESSQTIQQDSRIDINTATAEQLQQLRGIGPVMAQRIIDYRNAHGAFTTIDELQQVQGIGSKTLAKIRDSIRVGGSP